MPTPHISANKEDVARNVIMIGCPVRAKLLAEKYLESPKLVNTIRNMNMFTGTYKGKRVTVASSGMGVPSMDFIIRVGTSGGYTTKFKLSDIFLVTESYSTMTDYLELLTDEKSNMAYPSPELNKRLEESAQQLGIPMHKGRCHCTCLFYHSKSIEYLIEMTKADVVEMETYSLFINAKRANKQAAAVLTIADVVKIVDGVAEWDLISCHDREHAINNAFEVALGVAL